MRQIGFLAAACLYALDHHYPASIATAHAEAQRVVTALAAAKLRHTNDPVATNMVFMDLRTFPVALPTLVQTCLRYGVRVDAYSAHELRVVTHGQLHAQAVGKLVGALAECMRGR